MLLMTLLLACGPSAPGDWIGGDYQFFTLAVEDGCLDGAMEAIFMPSGPETEWAFEFPVHVPHPRDTPQTYDVDFRDPFVGMPVTIETAPFGMQLRGSVMDAVVLDEGNYGDCVATMTVDADLVAVEAGVIAADARIDMSNLRGEEERCPPVDADPCLVELELRADVIE